MREQGAGTVMREQVQGREHFPSSGHSRKPSAEVDVCMWWTQSLVVPPHRRRGAVQDTHEQGVIGLLGLGFPPRFEQMAQGPAEEERTVSSCPGTLEGSAYFPLVCQPALRFSSSAFSQHSQAVSRD